MKRLNINTYKIEIEESIGAAIRVGGRTVVAGIITKILV